MHLHRAHAAGRTAWLARAAVSALALAVTVGGAVPAALAATGSQPGQQEVSYSGYRFEVPASWPVIDLAAHPDTCVRYDGHAIYLGNPGTAEDCPSRVIGVAGALLLQPGTRSAAKRVTENPVAHRISVTSPGIRVTASYGSDRAEVRRILASASLPSPAASAPQPAPAPPVAAPSVAAPSVAAAATAAVTPAPANDTGKGFDACTAPSSSYMSAWLANSPYRAVGIYIGGADRGCSQPNLTAGWVSQQTSAGWHLIPLYAGPQASSGQLTSPSSRAPVPPTTR